MKLSVSSLLLMVASVSGAVPAHAGAWVGGGGGELVQDATNPWFLANTPRVSYCVEADEAAMGLRTPALLRMIEEALDYWRRGFRKTLTPSLGSEIATQTFVREPCREDTMLRFLFGVLSSEQEAHLKTPQKYVGITVRTVYDEVELRGRGFVYIAPQEGRLSFVRPGVAARPWGLGNGRLVYLTLLHELGHVFGVKHQGQMYQLMSADYPELIVQEGMAQAVAAMPDDPEFFDADTYAMCSCCEPVPSAFKPHRLAPRYLGYPESWGCLKADLVDGKLSILAKEALDTPAWTPVATGKVESKALDGLEHFISIRLTERQRVFDVRPSVFLWFGPYRQHWVHEGRLTTLLSGLERRFAATFHPFVKLSGAVDGEIVTDLFRMDLGTLGVTSGSRDGDARP